MRLLSDRQIIRKVAGIFLFDAEGLKSKNLRKYIKETYDRDVSGAAIQNVLGSLANRYCELHQPGAEEFAKQVLESCGHNLTVAQVVMSKVHYSNDFQLKKED